MSAARPVGPPPDQRPDEHVRPLVARDDLGKWPAAGWPAAQLFGWLPGCLVGKILVTRPSSNVKNMNHG